jgi:hypothetical protein
VDKILKNIDLGYLFPEQSTCTLVRDLTDKIKTDPSLEVAQSLLLAKQLTPKLG